jgi:hypothetical protein
VEIVKTVILIMLVLLLTACNIEPTWEIAPVTTMVSGDDVPRRLPNERHAPAGNEGLLVVEAQRADVQ